MANTTISMIKYDSKKHHLIFPCPLLNFFLSMRLQIVGNGTTLTSPYFVEAYYVLDFLMDGERSMIFNVDLLVVCPVQ